ncbi:hypothetical protein [Nostoc sphaeroides]|uniref:Uncharacterized protein n=2 Tax=Nostoc sphaeroides TaxID=446679 RepID=A0A5P8VY67_9NOSO|nr:hypothetical protein [Nostoc sphaeroides]QFS45261.1 hypothetical protein GXM_02738 [Nostoc sphaeroides CCNUC1]
MRYSIISQGVGARHCRALTGIPHGNENRYIALELRSNFIESFLKAIATVVLF